jgi:peptide/nickel transport system permease protein
VVFPAGALLITTLAFNLLGDGIRDAMDPRTERIFAARRKRRKKKDGDVTLSDSQLPSVPPTPSGSV